MVVFTVDFMQILVPVGVALGAIAAAAALYFIVTTLKSRGEDSSGGSHMR